MVADGAEASCRGMLGKLPNKCHIDNSHRQVKQTGRGDPGHIRALAADDQRSGVEPGDVTRAATVHADMTWPGLALAGFDIGGSKSRARLWAGGRIAAESEGPSASLPAAIIGI